eukprot:m.147055 g.147055  ORF g.147055 m.147055 type:complete len:401 (+) comp13239_c0_seq2:119-1321(+)
MDSVGVVGKTLSSARDCDATRGWRECKIGGTPVWLSQPSEDLIKCSKCHKLMLQLMQVYSTFDDSAFHRCLHVLTCVACQEYKAIRCMYTKAPPKQTEEKNSCNNDQLVGTEEESAKEEIEVNGENSDEWGDGDDWGDDGDDWGGDDGDDDYDEEEDGEKESDNKQNKKCATEETTNSIQSKLNEAMKKLQTTSHSAKATTKLDSVDLVEGVVDERLLCLTPKKLLFYAEPDGIGDGFDSQTEKLLEKYIKSGGVIGDVSSQEVGASTVGEEEYEDEVVHGDRVFDTYLKRIKRCPEQVVRYNEGEALPLQLTSTHAIPVEMEACPYCNGPRAYELQILPTIVDELQTTPASDMSDSELRALMLFGSVTVYTCIGDCIGGDEPSLSTAVEEAIDVSPAVE